MVDFSVLIFIDRIYVCIESINLVFVCKGLCVMKSLFLDRILKDYAAKEDFQSIEQIIVCLGKEFANAPTAQPRNGGLIGLAACAIALGKVSIVIC